MSAADSSANMSNNLESSMVTIRASDDMHELEIIDEIAKHFASSNESTPMIESVNKPVTQLSYINNSKIH